MSRILVSLTRNFYASSNTGFREHFRTRLIKFEVDSENDLIILVLMFTVIAVIREEIAESNIGSGQQKVCGGLQDPVHEEDGFPLGGS